MEKFFNTGPKSRLIMKLLGVPIVIILGLATLALAKDGNAQDLMKRSVTIEFNNREITKVLTSIGHKTNVRFTYLPGIFPVDAKVSVKFRNVSLENVLHHILDPYNVDYQTSGEFIILKKNSASPKSSVLDLKEEVFRNDDITVSGKVTDDKGESLPGVSIILKGTQRGTVTDVEGAFSFNVPDKASILVFSYVGYLQKEIQVGSQTSLTVQLAVDNKTLEEIVVVGYGSQKKSDVTGAIASLDGTKIARAATPDATGALQGQMPGVVVVKNVGKPGSGYNINIRGISSIGGSNSPLFVIDGIPTTTGMNELNPADIEKIDILKDASATAIYGSRGAKGVVIVTTKRGKSGKTSISYDAYAGVRTPTHLPEMFNGSEYVAFRTEMFKAQGKDVSRNNTTFFTPEQWKNIDEGKFTDWPKLILKNGLQMNHNITASGGDDKTRFAISAGLLQEDGNVKPEQFKRYTLRGNVDRQISAKWKAGLNMYFSQNLTNLGSSEALRSAYRLPPMAYPYDQTGAPAFRVYGTNSVTNPLFDQDNEIRQSRNSRTFGNIYVQVEPIKNLTLKSTISPNYSTERSGFYFGPLTKQSLGGSVPTQASNSSQEQLTWVLDNQATYEAQFGVHKLTATVVQSMQKDRTETSTITVDGIPYKSLWYNLATGGRVLGYGSGYVKSTLASAMGRVNYSYKEKYLLTATGRWDGSSRLAEGNQWGFFPSASLAWRISEEQFIKTVSAINDLKLRVSYGVTGNDRVNPYSTQAALGQTFYDFGGVFAPGYAPNQLPNKNLTWETTHEINVGLDFGFFSNRISGSIDVYNRLIDNILLSRQLPAPSGFSSITDNVGKLKNSGIELGLSSINVHAGKFMWKTDFVFDKNKNKILELNGGKKDDVGNKLFIGQPVQVNYDYVFDGIWQQDQLEAAKKYNQTPGQIRVKDLDGNGVINASDRQIIGKRIPTWTGSFSNTFRYGNLDLYIMLYTRRGEQYVSSFDATLMNYNQDYNQVKVDYWTASNPSQTHFQPGNPGPYTVIPTYRKVDFTRVGNITLGYNLPTGLIQKFKISNLRVYATATNPFLFTKYEGFDPEWPATNTYGTAVSTSSYLFGINLAF
ncbi:TonB-dependent receptor [Dyadobacter psychrotolerans]|uniref:TonB-dependent receptor n=2 Tax=Dyadobacter psychrotolerans TaxID=2541721 RepID=A0A4R5DY72_9BACT|nr:TonB-dependent receptor [Dyadobacter psychrotolerans]